MKRFSFPKNKRLVSNKQFKDVLARGLRVSDRLLTLYMAKNDCGYPRLGVSVGKFCGKAFVRNRLKRLLREAFRQSQERLPPGFDYLLMISHSGANLDKSGTKESARETPIGPPVPSAQSRHLRQLTFEQIKFSFLALVNSAVEKIEQK